MEPDARVTAIDISETSCAIPAIFKRSMTYETCAPPACDRADRRARRDVRPDRLHGVLHHLSDPDAGLRSLRNVLTVDGAMHVMVYAPYGRAGVTMMQDYCRLLGIGVRDADLRDLGETVQALSIRPSDRRRRETGEGFRPAGRARRRVAQPPGSRLFRAAALRLARAVRPQVRALARAGALSSAVRSDRAHAAWRRVLQRFPRAAQHAAMELLRGTMDRHSFVAYRDDREREAQPITFEGDAWRGFVPVRLAMDADTIKDRAPPRRLRRAHQSEPHLSRPCALHRRCAGAALARRSTASARSARFCRAPGDRAMSTAASSSSGSGSTT